MNGADIFRGLLGLNLAYESFDWLEGRGLSGFEILSSVVLTQNTNWNNVLKALANLKSAHITTLEGLKSLENEALARLIKPSGFYNTKAKRLKTLVEAILQDFGDLENFKLEVSREWLLGVKGLGEESADGILNYLCGREILVVDRYTQRLASALGYEFESYGDLQEFFQSGVEAEAEGLCEILGRKAPLYELYQILHALIVAFAKEYFRGKKLSERGAECVRKIGGQNVAN
ncbi:3-methyladenine DNA glycosylase [Campylobacter sp.]|uniref:3-methyladenine DNA glycosylase n=1 Tax=Campylobacter sp. TaxID=205 RepID=UPI0026DB9223|nr:3-methyladenine DNA glycosylase [Campylobacter sp.]MDO4673881.1 3-methyladenine DNA glycosylase [Campylobacter sp.]